MSTENIYSKLYNGSEVVVVEYMDSTNTRQKFGFIFYDPTKDLSLLDRVQLVSIFMSQNYEMSWETTEDREFLLNPKIILNKNKECFSATGQLPRVDIWPYFFSTDSTIQSGGIFGMVNTGTIQEVLWAIAKTGEM